MTHKAWTLLLVESNDALRAEIVAVLNDVGYAVSTNYGNGGRRGHMDPKRSITTLKTAWGNVRRNAKVIGRWHDNWHTLITELAESR